MDRSTPAQNDFRIFLHFFNCWAERLLQDLQSRREATLSEGFYLSLIQGGKLGRFNNEIRGGMTQKLRDMTQKTRNMTRFPRVMTQKSRDMTRFPRTFSFATLGDHFIICSRPKL